MWWAAACMGCWGPQTHRSGRVPCSVRCLWPAVSQGWVVGHAVPADGAVEMCWEWAKAAWFMWWPHCWHWLRGKGGVRAGAEEKTALRRQISMAAFLAGLPKCLVWKQFSLVKPKEQHPAAFCLLIAQQGAVYGRRSAHWLITFQDIFELFLITLFVFDSQGSLTVLKKPVLTVRSWQYVKNAKSKILVCDEIMISGLQGRYLFLI